MVIIKTKENYRISEGEMFVNLEVDCLRNRVSIKGLNEKFAFIGGNKLSLYKWKLILHLIDIALEKGEEILRDLKEVQK
jgi:hypothetical protein